MRIFHWIPEQITEKTESLVSCPMNFMHFMHTHCVSSCIVLSSLWFCAYFDIPIPHLLHLAKYCPPYIYFTWLNQTDIFVYKNLSIFSFELFHSSISDEFDSFTFMNLIKRWSQIKQS